MRWGFCTGLAVLSLAGCGAAKPTPAKPTPAKPTPAKATQATVKWCHGYQLLGGSPPAQCEATVLKFADTSHVSQSEALKAWQWQVHFCPTIHADKLYKC
jgi:hypothetical protein